mmetsp:Transcript_53373/g.153933  ORF Transcript_53373/g.153933 Transcript_53373/m.153933 type:complete len:378 (-) Transcript_53373:681-1814(-)
MKGFLVPRIGAAQHPKSRPGASLVRLRRGELQPPGSGKDFGIGALPVALEPLTPRAKFVRWSMSAQLLVFPLTSAEPRRREQSRSSSQMATNASSSPREASAACTSLCNSKLASKLMLMVFETGVLASTADDLGLAPWTELAMGPRGTSLIVTFRFVSRRTGIKSMAVFSDGNTGTSSTSSSTSMISTATYASSAIASCNMPKLMRRLSLFSATCFPATPPLPKPTDLGKLLWCKPSSLSISSRHAFSHNRAVLCVLGLMRSNNRLFISFCINCAGKSFTSSPNGFSSSAAMELSDQRKNTCMNVSAPAQSALFTHMHVKKGVENQCRTKSNSKVCTYGKGNGILAIRIASWYRTMPPASSWNARDKIGGATLKVPR